MEDGGALPPADAEPAVQQPQKAQRGQKGLPRNIIESKVFRKKTQQWVVKYQARVHFKLPKDDKPTPHAVGGLHDTVEAAVAAQQEAKRMIEEYGAAAVWPKAFDETAAARCKRGTAPPRNDGGGGRKKAAKPAGAQERTEPKYGRGEHPNSRKNMDKGRAKKMQEQTEAERLSTVPLPADRNEINVACTRDFLVDPPHVTPHQPSPRAPQPPLHPLHQLPPIPVHLAQTDD